MAGGLVVGGSRTGSGGAGFGSSIGDGTPCGCCGVGGNGGGGCGSGGQGASGKKVAGQWQRRPGQASCRRAPQPAVIASAMAEAPTLAAMATGAGKSLCWRLPAVPLRVTTLVVAPRIALVTRALARPRDAVVSDIARLREIGRCAVLQQRRRDPDAVVAALPGDARRI